MSASLGERALRERGVAYVAHEYDYRKKGAEAAAEALGVELSATLKTLVVRLDGGPRGDRFVFLLESGDRQVSLKGFARAVGAREAELAPERDAERLTGYQVGGIGPFGSRTALPVYVDLEAARHERVLVNGGRRGLLLELTLDDLLRAADAELVDVALA